ncbi:helix-hairpin-helix domain-containing protein [Candidatus Gottesmanbacteria bacterium]|nr:helix-hairpin-helix domain-containing protein [Candidatus Gottesmanbacteria bacterium]
MRRYKIPIILGSGSVFFIIISFILLFKSTQLTKPIQFSQDQLTASASGVQGVSVSVITVDVEGAVVKPGIYRLSRDARVDDAIAAAGGFSTEADLDRIAATMNRAAKLVDGGKLYFPKKGEISSPSLGSVGNPGTVGDLRSPVNINTGTESALESLPGVGPVTAKKIIDNRPYQTLEELVSKKAVGQSLFEKIKEKIAL